MAVDLLDLGEFTGNEDEGSGFNPIDSGRYKATVFGLSREVGKNSGKPYLKWEFAIADGEPFAGRHLWDNTSLSDNAKWRLVSLLKALGVDVPKGRLKIDPNYLMGREVILTVGQEPDEYHDPDGDEGLMRNVIKGFAPAGGAAKPKIQIPDAPAPTPKPAPKKSAKKRPKKAEEAQSEAPWDEPKNSKPDPLPVTDVDSGDDDEDFDFE